MHLCLLRRAAGTPSGVVMYFDGCAHISHGAFLHARLLCASLGALLERGVSERSERELARAERAHVAELFGVWRSIRCVCGVCALCFGGIVAVRRRHRASPASVSRCKMCVVMGLIYSD